MGVAGESTGKGGLVIDLANNSNQFASLAKDTISIYPCGLSSVPRKSIADENPVPFPGRNLSTDPIGSIIIIQVPFAQSTSWQPGNVLLSEKNLNSIISIAQPVNRLDDNIRVYAAGKPLKSNTTYSVTVDGLLNGVAYKRGCDFSTGI